MSDVARIIGAYEHPYTRHPAAGVRTVDLLATAIRSATLDAGVDLADVDGLGVASFTLGPDHAVDLARSCGLRLRWIMEDTNGGASGVNLLQHAIRAVDAGDAETIVLVAGDIMTGDAHRRLVDSYNAATRDLITPLGVAGPNSAFAMLTLRHMRETGLQADDYGHIAVAQRRWAGLNPGAVYRTPMTLEDYRTAPVVSEPLRRFDCVPPVAGADVLVVTSRPHDGPSVRVRAIAGTINTDLHEGDGLHTGLAAIASRVWDHASVSPEDVDVISVYDDYPVMVAIQLADCGLLGDDVPAEVARIDSGRRAVNTSGGQLSSGQAGAAGGMHGLVETVTQLHGRAGDRQVADARIAMSTGYGMVTYRYGSCANMAVLERV
ncbi:MAG: thiolase family protein [Gordonia paraffinivorans]